MKEKWKNTCALLLQAIRKNPIEMWSALLFCIAGCCYYESNASCWENLLYYAPVLFLITNSLNRLTAGKRGRWLYYFSGVFFLPFYLVGWSGWTITYLVSVIVVQLLYLISGWNRENRSFVASGLTYLGALLSAWVLAQIAWMLAISIYWSVSYIFEIGETQRSRFITYAFSFCYGGLIPLLFLTFHEKREFGRGGNKVFEVLLNFVLSPALLIYAGILYLYFLKIIILWSLPKGAVAYIVVSFVAGGFVLKGCQLFLSQRRYDWFYNRFSLAVLPALAMYWVGSLYRIRQYGFTEARVYLVVTGLILTGAALLFFSRRTGRYLYVALLAVVLLSVVTYVPGITAADIGRISQAGRPVERLWEGDASTTYMSIQLDEPVDVRGYATVQPVLGYNGGNKKEIWADCRPDSFFLMKGEKDTLLAMCLDSLLYRQFQRAGIARGDTIPRNVYPVLLEIEMDSARFIMETMSLEQTLREGTASYRVNNIYGGFYLKR